MNKLTGQIIHIESNGLISLVDIAVGGSTMTATVLEAPGASPYLRLHAEIIVMFKPTEVSLGKQLSGLLSLRNRLSSTVTMIERGALLTTVTLDYQGMPLQSVVTSRAVDALSLQVGDTVEALIKASEVLLGASK